MRLDFVLQREGRGRACFTWHGPDDSHGCRSGDGVRASIGHAGVPRGHRGELTMMVGRPPELGTLVVERVTGIEPALSAWESDRSGASDYPDLGIRHTASDRHRPCDTRVDGPPMARGLIVQELARSLSRCRLWLSPPWPSRSRAWPRTTSSVTACCQAALAPAASPRLYSTNPGLRAAGGTASACPESMACCSGPACPAGRYCVRGVASWPHARQLPSQTASSPAHRRPSCFLTPARSSPRSGIRLMKSSIL